MYRRRRNASDDHLRVTGRPLRPATAPDGYAVGDCRSGPRRRVRPNEAHREWHLIQVSTSTRAVVTAQSNDHLQHLVDRIADGDRTAFRCLYAFLAMRVWRDTLRVLPAPADARAVTRSTFVEVWHLAGHHVDHLRSDARTWIAAITARQVDDRLRAHDTSGRFLVDHDNQVHRELAALLGAAQATIRIGAATFARVADLNLDLAT